MTCKGILKVNDYWIDVKTVARLKGISSRAVRLKLDKYVSREVQNGKSIKYEILLSSLDSDLQQKYLDEHYKNLIPVKDDKPLVLIEQKKQPLIPNKAKEVALARFDLLQSWNKFRNENQPVKKADEVFLDLYNSGAYHYEIYRIIGKISIGTIYRWQRRLGDINSSDWTKLISNYSFSSVKEYRTILTDEEKQLLLKFLLHPNKFSIGKAITYTRHILEKNGIENMPSVPTFRRFAEHFKKYNYDKWVLAREGEKALRDKVEPFIIRDATLLEAGQVLVADGHRLNFMVKNPFTGKPCRAILVGFLDWRSGALVGYEVMLEENTQCIASALRNAILNLGKIPEYIYQDNGKAFKAKYFQGCGSGSANSFSSKDFEELGFNGIYGNLGIKTVFAQPYNARAKVIERFFLEFQESFEKLMCSYIGTSIEHRPAYLKRNEKLHQEIYQEKIPSIQETIRMVDTWLEFRHSQPCPHEPDKSIAEVLRRIKPNKLNKNDLDDLMMATDIKSVGRNGIRFLNTNYFDEELYGFKDKVKIKYSLFDLSSIKVYTIKGEYLCTAERVTLTHPLAYHMGSIKDMEDFKQKIQKPKQLRNKTIKQVKRFISKEDADFLEEEMEREHFDKLEKEIEQVEVKEQVESPVPSFFSNNFERFDYLKRQANLSEEESAWVIWYKTTDEYKELYE